MKTKKKQKWRLVKCKECGFEGRKFEFERQAQVQSTEFEVEDLWTLSEMFRTGRKKKKRRLVCPECGEEK